MTIPIGTLCLIVWPTHGNWIWKDPCRIVGRTCTVIGAPAFMPHESRVRHVPVEPADIGFVAEPCLVPITPPQTDLAIERLTTLPATC
jgi:hypothetical protein